MKKKGIVITAVAAAAVILVAALAVPKGGNGSGTALTETYNLEKTDLKVMVSADGNVKSKNVKNIYTNLNYPVKEIMVKTGDRVKAGDVLCLLDSEDLESQIALQEANLESSNISSYYQASESEKTYNEAKFNFDSGLNIELNNAENALKTAEIELEDIKKQYNDKQNNLNNDNDTELVNAKVEIKNKEISKNIALKEYNESLGKFPDQKALIAPYDEALKKAKTELDSAKAYLKSVQGKDTETVGAAAEKLNKAQTKYDKAYDDMLEAYTVPNSKNTRMRYENAVKAYEDAQDKLNDLTKNANTSISDIEKALKNAQNTYDKAKNAYEAAKNSAEKQLETYKVSMEKDKQLVSNQPKVVELMNLRNKFTACTVKATQDGVITAVNAVEGQNANGVLFEIQDDKNLQIESEIKEYDIKEISDGMPAIIKSDVTGDNEFQGTVTHISPSAVKSQDANVFPVIIDVTDSSSGLLIGTKARIKVTSQEKSGIFAVRFDSIKTNENGENVIYIAEPAADGTYSAREIAVQVGMETDYEIEVISSELTEGMLVIANAENITNGTAIAVMK